MQFLWKYVDDLVGKGLEFSVLAEMIFYASFGLLPYAFPLAMLLASIMTFGSLGENYELLAMKSAGISLFRIMKPLMVIAIIVAFAAFYFANNILPHTNLKFTTLLYSVKEQNPELVLREGVFTEEITDYSIKVGKKNSKTNMMYDWLIYDHRGNRANESVTVADSGFVKITEDRKYMVLNLFNGVNYSEEELERNRKNDKSYPYRRDRFKEQTVRIELRGFEFNRRDESIFKNTYRMLNISQLVFMEDSLTDTYRSRLRNYITQINLNRAVTRNVYNLTAHQDSLKRQINLVADSVFSFDAYFNRQDNWIKAEIAGAALASARSNVQSLNLYDGQLYNSKKYLNKFKMERHRKFTLSLAVLIFFFIGAPLGAIIRKGGLGMPVVVSILLFISYYIFSMTGEKSAREDVWSMFSGMWFSTFIFLPVGVWLSYKAATDAALMNAETYTKLFSKLGLGKLFEKRKKINEHSAGYQ